MGPIAGESILFQRVNGRECVKVSCFVKPVPELRYGDEDEVLLQRVMLPFM